LTAACHPNLPGRGDLGAATGGSWRIRVAKRGHCRADHGSSRSQSADAVRQTRPEIERRGRACGNEAQAGCDRDRDGHAAPRDRLEHHRGDGRLATLTREHVDRGQHQRRRRGETRASGSNRSLGALDRVERFGQRRNENGRAVEGTTADWALRHGAGISNEADDQTVCRAIKSIRRCDVFLVAAFVRSSLPLWAWLAGARPCQPCSV